MIDQTRADILALLKARELVNANSTNPREVLKDKKIKQYISDVSRLSEESQGVKVSSETCLLSPTSSSSSGIGSSISSLESVTSSPGEEVVISPAATTSSRGFTGISLQHSKTTKGVKVMINLQTAAQARSGDITTLTAELKRWDRLRELKPYDADSDEFAQVYADSLVELKDMKPEARKHYCIGRIHDRGSRSEWYPDMFMIAVLDDAGSVRTAYLNIDGEEYEVTLDAELSERQQRVFHSTGIYGELKNNRPVPRLSTAPTRRL